MKIPHLRWLVAFALFFAALLNYVDRNVLGLLAATIQKDLHISNQDYASVVNYFLIAYTIANLLSGRVVDRLGVRWSLALFLGWWTISNALTGFAQNLGHLCALRFLLGLGEAGCYTASPKAVREWFPTSERATAVGLYSSGGAVGATVAPVLVALVVAHFGWRAAFAVTPVMAVIWLAGWLWLYRNPVTHPNLTEEERSCLAENLADTSSPQTAEPRESELALWGRVLRQPVVWQLMLARLLTDPLWYFLQFWFPKYLQNVRGLDQKGVAAMWMIFLAATVGFLVGGWLSGRRVKQGAAAPAARLQVMAMSACIAPLSFFIPSIPSIVSVFAITILAAYAVTAWLSNITSLVVDLVPQRTLGTAFGVIACGSALGGFFMNKGVAWFIDHRSYSECFYAMAFLHPIALALLWNLRRHRNPDSELAPMTAVESA